MSKRISILILIFFIFSSVILVFGNKIVQAGDLGESIGTKIKNVGGGTYDPQEQVGLAPGDKNLLGMYKLAIGLITSFVGVMFFIQTIVGGIQWMTAGGNEEKVAAAKTRFINGTIGITIILSAYIITYFVLYRLTDVTGVDTGFQETTSIDINLPLV